MRGSPTRKVRLELGMRNSLHLPLSIVTIYVVLIACAELIGVSIGMIPSVLCHALLIPVLLGHYVTSQAPYRRVLPVLALAPLMRLFGVTILTRQVPQIYWYAIIGLPLLVAAAMTARLIEYSWSRFQLRATAWLPQLLIASSGLPLGFAAFLLLRPQPLDGISNWRALLIGSAILLIFTGFTEEIIFRGLLHHVASDLFGRMGLFLSSALFAIMYIGSLVPAYVLFAGMVGLFFGWCVDRTRSLWGVALAHGLLNIGLMLVWPAVDARANVARIVSPELVAMLELTVATILGFGMLIRWQRRWNAASLPALAPAAPQAAFGVGPAAQVPSVNGAAMASGIERCSVAEVAQRLGCSPSTVRKWIKNGTLAAERDGNRWIVLLPSSEEKSTIPLPASPANTEPTQALIAPATMALFRVGKWQVWIGGVLAGLLLGFGLLGMRGQLGGTRGAPVSSVGLPSAASASKPASVSTAALGAISADEVSVGVAGIARPTALPAITSGRLLLAEPFTTAGWAEQSGKGWRIGYQGGHYRIIVTRGLGAIWTYRSVPVEDVGIAVDVRALRGTGGLLLRFEDEQTYLSFCVDPRERSFRLEQNRDGTVIVLASGRSDAIASDGDAWNRIAARLRGKHIQLLANDQPLAEIDTPEDIGGSRYGLLADGDESDSEVYFDNLEIRTIE